MRQRAGRQNQKQRTRNAIVGAARDLVSQGRLPSVAEVAEVALVSPATAYRYFPDQLSLLRAALQETKPHDEQIATPVADATADPAERIAHATTAFLRLTLERESLVRAVIALSLLRSVEEPAARQEAAALRPGYRKTWIAEALAPLKETIDADTLRRLTNALAVVMSSEALITLQDVCGLDAQEAVDICTWAARTLVHAVVGNLLAADNR
jgi:AcrR family transcriptional regulator